METYSVRIINKENQYNGYVYFEKDNTFYGKAFEVNDDTEVILYGSFFDNKIVLSMLSASDKKQLLAIFTNEFPKKSFTTSSYFFNPKKQVFIEFTNLKRINDNKVLKYDNN